MLTWTVLSQVVIRASALTRTPCFFFFNDTATTEIYTLSLHDALPIYRAPLPGPRAAQARECLRGLLPLLLPPRDGGTRQADAFARQARCGARLHPGASRHQIGRAHV